MGIIILSVMINTNKIMTILITSIMLTSVFSTGAVYGLEPANCSFGASAIAVKLQPDVKGKATDALNIKVDVENDGDFIECDLRIDEVTVVANAVTICTSTLTPGITVVGGATVPLFGLGGTGQAGAGNSDSVAGECKFIPENHAAPANVGAWTLVASISGVNFNTANNDTPAPASASTPGGIALASPSVTLVKTVDPLKAAVNPDDANSSVKANWTFD